MHFALFFSARHLSLVAKEPKTANFHEKLNRNNKTQGKSFASCSPRASEALPSAPETAYCSTADRLLHKPLRIHSKLTKTTTTNSDSEQRLLRATTPTSDLDRSNSKLRLTSAPPSGQLQHVSLSLSLAATFQQHKAPSLSSTPFVVVFISCLSLRLRLYT